MPGGIAHVRIIEFVLVRGLAAVRGRSGFWSARPRARGRPDAVVGAATPSLGRVRSRRRSIPLRRRPCELPWDCGVVARWSNHDSLAW